MLCIVCCFFCFRCFLLFTCFLVLLFDYTCNYVYSKNSTSNTNKVRAATTKRTPRTTKATTRKKNKSNKHNYSIKAGTQPGKKLSLCSLMLQVLSKMQGRQFVMRSARLKFKPAETIICRSCNLKGSIFQMSQMLPIASKAEDSSSKMMQIDQKTGQARDLNQTPKQCPSHSR